MAHWFFNFVADTVFISGNVPATAAAITILCSLWVTVGCFVWSLCTRYGSWRNSKKTEIRSVSTSSRNISAFRIGFRTGFFHRKHHLIRQIPHQQYLLIKNLNRNLSCVICGSFPYHPACLYTRCEDCCKASKTSICMDVGIFGYQSNEEFSYEGPCEVDFSFLKLTTCPNRMGYIGPQLSCLNLSNNSLTSLPEEISLLRGLECLYLQYNCLKELPDSIGYLINLVDLNVKNNQIEKIPESVGNLVNLHCLNITNNLIKSLPSVLGNLVSLVKLSAYSNKLNELPAEVCNLINLEALYVGQNFLQTLPDRIGNLIRLWELDVSECSLTILPDSITYCANLERLWLSKNKLRYLPDQMGQLHSLKELNIRDNLIQYFPASLKYLQLYTFSVSQNPLLDDRDKVAIASLTVHCPNLVPTLVELSAHKIARENIKWHPNELPKELQDLLSQKKQCSHCRGVFFNFFHSSIVFDIVGFVRVPLYQKVCTFHSD